MNATKINTHQPLRRRLSRSKKRVRKACFLHRDLESMVATGHRARSVLEVTGKNGGMPGPTRRMVRVPASDGRRHLAAPAPTMSKSRSLDRRGREKRAPGLHPPPPCPVPPLTSGTPAMTQTTGLQCSCGQVYLEVEHPPIVSTECHCNSCRAAGARLRALPLAPA